MNKFPWNCGECPLLQSYDLSVDDLTYVCLWSKAQIDDCDRYKSAQCPLEEHDAKVKADAIEEFRKDIIDEINFEDKWLLDCKRNNADTAIVFSALRNFVNDRAKQLKEKNINDDDSSK